MLRPISSHLPFKPSPPNTTTTPPPPSIACASEIQLCPNRKLCKMSV